MTADLAEARWRKLVWNVPFNGLTILADARRPPGTPPFSTADLLADDSLSYLARRLMDEIIAAAHRLGHAIPTDFPDLQLKRTANMGAYLPSTLLDFRAGRPLELEAIWGEPYRRAFNVGAEVGRMETLYHLLRHTGTKRPGSV